MCFCRGRQHAMPAPAVSRAPYAHVVRPQSRCSGCCRDVVASGVRRLQRAPDCWCERARADTGHADTDAHFCAACTSAPLVTAADGGGEQAVSMTLACVMCARAGLRYTGRCRHLTATDSRRCRHYSAAHTQSSLLLLHCSRATSSDRHLAASPSWSQACTEADRVRAAASAAPWRPGRAWSRLLATRPGACAC